jgi:hypothetical protein
MESSIDKTRRLVFAQTLAWHLFPKDTTMTPEKIHLILYFRDSFSLIEGLTFEDGEDDIGGAMTRGTEVTMLKAYCLVSEFMSFPHDIRMSEEMRQKQLDRVTKASRLFNVVQATYPHLNISSLGHTLAARIGQRLVAAE